MASLTLSDAIALMKEIAREAGAQKDSASFVRIPVIDGPPLSGRDIRQYLLYHARDVLGSRIVLKVVYQDSIELVNLKRLRGKEQVVPVIKLIENYSCALLGTEVAIVVMEYHCPLMEWLEGESSSWDLIFRVVQRLCKVRKGSSQRGSPLFVLFPERFLSFFFWLKTGGSRVSQGWAGDW